jgi:hypothetical protein
MSDFSGGTLSLRRSMRMVDDSEHEGNLATAVDIGHIIRMISNYGIHYVLYQWLCVSLVWHWVCFTKDLYDKIYFILMNGEASFIMYLSFCDYWFKLANKKEKLSLVMVAIEEYTYSNQLVTRQ